MNDLQDLFRSMLDPIIKECIQKNLEGTVLGNENHLLPEYLTQDQAARFLGLSKSALYSMTSKNEIAYHKKGRRNYFKKSDLRNWIESGRIRPFSEIREKMK
ncbi:MAG: DNA-binding protein [Porphyromonadaceae bacterium]|nr:MAG: DNA-binding protein [Porphyromonadaceae bacterium]